LSCSIKPKLTPDLSEAKSEALVLKESILLGAAGSAFNTELSRPEGAFS